jgi:signal transduction histidine kinase
MINLLVRHGRLQPGLPHLFERFHRGRNASRYPGSGLGLAIAKALVDLQGGSVQAVSAVGGGTCIRVALPLPVKGDKD